MWVCAPRSRCEQVCAARQGAHGAAESQHLDELRDTRRRHSHTHAVSNTGFGRLFMQQATAVECTLDTSSGAGCPHRCADHHILHGTCTSRDVRTATILSRCPPWSQGQPRADDLGTAGRDHGHARRCPRSYRRRSPTSRSDHAQRVGSGARGPGLDREAHANPLALASLSSIAAQPLVVSTWHTTGRLLISRSAPRARPQGQPWAARRYFSKKMLATIVSGGIAA